MNPTLTLHKEKKPGFLTLGEAFNWMKERLEDFADETISRHRADGDSEEQLAVLSAHLLHRRAEILGELFGPFLRIRH